MADLGAIEIPIVTKERGLKESLRTITRLEGEIRRAVKAANDQTISQTRLNAVLLKAKREYQALGVTSQRATSEVRKYAAQQAVAMTRTINTTKSINSQSAAFTRQASAVNTFNKSQMAATKGNNQFGVVAQQTGYQVGDFLVQIQSGTNPMVAFGQQATQLVGVLPLMAGALGITTAAAIGLSTALGIGIPLLTAIGAYLMRARESAKEAAGGIETLEDRLKSAKNATSSLSAEIERLNMGFKDTAEQSFSDAVKETADAILEIQGKLNTLFDDGPKRGSSNVAREYREEIAALNELLSARRIDLETYIQTRAELARIKELEEGRIASVKLFFEYAQRDLELAKERSEAVDAIRASVDGEVKSLESQIALNKEILRFGEDSAQVAALKASQDRESYMLQQQAAGILGNNLKTVMDTYDELVSTEATLKESATAAQQLADALNSAAVFSGNLDKSVDALRARLAEAKGEQGAVLANTIEQMRAEAQLSAARARAAGEDDLVVRNRLALDQAQIDSYAELTAEIDSLSGAGKGANKEQKDLVKSFEKQLDLQRQLVGQSEAYIAVRKALGDSYDKVDPKRIRSLEIQYEQTQKIIEQEEAVQGVISGIADSWAKFVSEGFKDFKGFAQSVFNVFKNLLVQMIATAAKNKILISLGMGGSVAGTAASAAAGSAAGTAAGSAAAAGTAAAGYANFAAGVGSTMGTAAGTAAAGTAAGSTTMFAIGAAAPYILAAVLIIGLLSKKVTTSLKEIDSGVSGMVKGFDVAIKNFSVIEKTVTTSRFFGLSKKKSVSTETVEQDAPDSPLIAAVGEIQQSVLTAAEAFGFGADAFKDFSYEFKLSLMGLSDDQKVQKINEELTRMGDAFADMLPHFSSMNELLEAAEHRYQIENRMLEALGRSTEVVIRNRERELAATHALNRGLLQATFDLEDANAAVSAAMDGLRRAIDAEKDRLRSTFDGIVEAIRNSFEMVIKDLRDKLSLANEAVGRSRSIFRQLESALSGRSVTSDIGQTFARREGALSFIRGGDFSDEKKLEEALGVVSEPTEGLFSSFIEYARDFARTSLTLEEAKNVAQTQLTVDEQQVLLLEQQIVDADRNLEQQLANADSNLERQLAALEQQYQTEVDQYNALMGIDTSVKSVGDAIATLRGAIEALASAQAAAKAVASAPSIGGPAGAVDMNRLGPSQNGTLEALAGGGARVTFPGGGSHTVAGAGGLELLGKAYGFEGFAAGGMHSGGMRLVGEEGPELEVTGPSRIYSKQQTKELLKGDSNEGEGLRAEVSEMRQELRQLLIANNKYTKRSYDLYNKWDIDGLPAERT
jgi:hypothetical protein